MVQITLGCRARGTRTSGGICRGGWLPARGSLAELSTQVEIATSLEMLPLNQRLGELLPEVDRILQALIRSLEEKIKPRKRTPGPNP